MLAERLGLTSELLGLAGSNKKRQRGFVTSTPNIILRRSSNSSCKCISITRRSVHASIILHLISTGAKIGLRCQEKSVLAAHELYRNIHDESAIRLKIIQPSLRVGAAFRKYSEVCSQNQTSGLITLPLFPCLSAASYSQTRQQGITLFSAHNTARWRLSHEGARILMRQRQWHTAA